MTASSQNTETRSEQIDRRLYEDARRGVARAMNFTGDSCHECGNFTMVRTGTCLSCVSCGATSGCS